MLLKLCSKIFTILAAAGLFSVLALPVPDASTMSTIPDSNINLASQMITISKRMDNRPPLPVLEPPVFMKGPERLLDLQGPARAKQAVLPPDETTRMTSKLPLPVSEPLAFARGPSERPLGLQGPVHAGEAAPPPPGVTAENNVLSSPQEAHAEHQRPAASHSLFAEVLPPGVYPPHLGRQGGRQFERIQGYVEPPIPDTNRIISGSKLYDHRNQRNLFNLLSNLMLKFKPSTRARPSEEDTFLYNGYLILAEKPKEVKAQIAWIMETKEYSQDSHLKIWFDEVFARIHGLHDVRTYKYRTLGSRDMVYIGLADPHNRGYEDPNWSSHILMFSLAFLVLVIYPGPIVKCIRRNSSRHIVRS
ncbi:hypothetical protein EV360DRAFT_69043 [Lentinula raphanica]|nr:hypothetical protein EV360DRAFT_69043 [Lentinula raphanica]